MALIVKIGADLNNFQKQMRKLTKDVDKVGEHFKNVGSALSGLTLPILGVGAASGFVANEVDSSQAKIQNSLGLSTEEAEKLTSVARDIYNKGFGQSFDEVERALLQTKQNIKDINNEDLDNIVTQAIILAETFDSDVNEVTRAGNNLMEGFGLSSQKAFDLMAYGAQNGLNFSNEMFDNLSEYSTLFGSMGYSADEYFQLLINGTKAGVYNLDYINDVMKEFQIRAKDGSKSTSDAMEQLSSSTQKVWKQYLKGDATVKDVSNAVLAELEGMDNQVKANEIGVALYGTKWEDLEQEAMYALGGIGGELENVDGTMSKMAEVQEETFGQRFQSMIRGLKDALLPLGEVLLGIAESVLPKIQSIAESISGWFENLSPKTQQLVVGLAGLAAAIGPILIAVGTGLMLFGKLKAILSVLQIGFLAVSWPILAVIAALAGIIAVVVYWEEIKTFFINLWGYLKNLFFESVEYIRNVFQGLYGKAKPIIDAIGNALSTGWNFIKTVTVAVFSFISSYIKAVWDAIWFFIGPTVTKIVNTILEKWNRAKAVTSTVLSAMKTVVTSVFNTIRSTTSSVWNALVSLISGPVQTIKSNVATAFGGMKTTILGVWTGIKTGLRVIINGIIQLINKFIGKFNGPAKLLNKIPGVNAPIIPKIPMLATGGNVSGSGAFITGEAGPELVEKSGSSVKVTPLSSQEKANGIGGALGGKGKIEIPLFLDGYEIARATYDHINGMFEADASSKLFFSGVR